MITSGLHRPPGHCDHVMAGSCPSFCHATTSKFREAVKAVKPLSTIIARAAGQKELRTRVKESRWPDALSVKYTYCCQQTRASTGLLGLLEFNLHQTYSRSTFIHINGFCQVQSYLSSRYQRLTYNTQTIEYHLSRKQVTMTPCLACLLYAAGAVITIILGVIDTARPHPNGPFRLPRCLGHRYLHHTLAFVCAGLLWPLFVVFVYLRMKVDELEEAGND